jgi:hypothetical protein
LLPVESVFPSNTTGARGSSALILKVPCANIAPPRPFLALLFRNCTGPVMLVVDSIVAYIAPPLSPAILFSNLLTPLKSIFPYKLTTAPPLEVSDSLFKKVLPLIRALLETIAPPKLYAELPLNILFSISKLSLIIAPAILPVERLLLNIEFVIVNFPEPVIAPPSFRTELLSNVVLSIIRVPKLQLHRQFPLQ